MKRIMIGNLKGGVGKTTSAVNLSYSFSLLGKKVLIVDMDPQSNATSFFAKVNQNGRTVKELFLYPEKGSKVICRSKYRNIDIIKGNTELKEDNVVSTDVLANVLDTVEDRYDICIMDTRPAIEKITCAAICAADVLLTPINLDNFCRDNLAMLEETLATLPYGVEWKIFANKVNTHRKAQRNIYKDLLMRQEYPLLETCISESAAIGNALCLYKPVARHCSNAVPVIDYMELAKELLTPGGLVYGKIR